MDVLFLILNSTVSEGPSVLDLSIALPWSTQICWEGNVSLLNLVALNKVFGGSWYITFVSLSLKEHFMIYR